MLDKNKIPVSITCILLMLCCATVAYADSSPFPSLPYYYSNALPAIKKTEALFTGETISGDLTARTLMNYCYVLASAKADSAAVPTADTDVQRALKLLDELQDKNPESKTFGNFRWYWRNTAVTDYNAVEFVCHRGLALWFYAKDSLPPESRLQLAQILYRCIAGSIKHAVRPDYTNIALLNSINLILLGQEFKCREAAAIGSQRLNAVLLAFYDHGIYEYNSPTYYAVDFDALELGCRYIKSQELRETVKGLLRYFTLDLTANWFVPSQRQAGAQSRTYNFLYGTAGSTRQASILGLLPFDKNNPSSDYLFSLQGIKQESRDRAVPRLVERQWGSEPAQWARTYLLQDIVLGTAGATYTGARHDMPLTVDFAGIPQRFYFVADGRGDPYGQKKFALNENAHAKALHLEAFWAGAQRTVDALGITLHTPQTFQDPFITDVQSSFVFPKPSAVRQLPAVICLRYNSCAVGIRILWSRNATGEHAQYEMVDDKNPYGVQRITLNHGLMKNALSTGAAFWIRIGSQLDTDEKFQRWCENLAEAKVEKLEVNGNAIAVRVAGVDGPVAVSCEDCYKVVSDPPRPAGILMCDGKDIGKQALETIPAMKEWIECKERLQYTDIAAAGTYWEAKTNYLSAGFVAGGQALVIDRECTWGINIRETGTYYLWGRVFAVDSEHDSFYIDVFNEQNRNAVRTDWHIGSGRNWHWVLFKQPLQLSAGRWNISLRPREEDGRIERFFITADKSAAPH